MGDTDGRQRRHNMTRVAKRLVAALIVSFTLAAAAAAAQPADPGCFGTDRADYFQTHMGVGGPGGSGTGAILAGRAGTNGDLNRQYMEACGQTP
jgi:hypothetical protein